MTILHNIVEPNINELLDNAENPVEMASQYLVEYWDALYKVRKHTVETINEGTKLEVPMKEKEREIEKCHDIEENQRLKDELKKLRESYVNFIEEARESQAYYSALVKVIRELEDKCDMLKEKK